MEDSRAIVNRIANSPCFSFSGNGIFFFLDFSDCKTFDLRKDRLGDGSWPGSNFEKGLLTDMPEKRAHFGLEYVKLTQKLYYIGGGGGSGVSQTVTL